MLASFLILTLVRLFVVSPSALGEYALLFHLPHVASVIFNVILAFSHSKELFYFEFFWQTFVVMLDVTAVVSVVYSLVSCFNGVLPASCNEVVFSNIVAGVLSVPILVVSLYIWHKLLTVVRALWFVSREKTHKE